MGILNVFLCLSRRQKRGKFNVVIFTAVFALLGLAFGCSNGTSNTPQTTAPSALIYPQTTITVTVGQAIATDAPTVSGTAPSYSISPALPAGLSLNSSTGAISGTPTAATPQVAYIVTATNAAGSTMASVQIAVSPAIPPPSNLAYPQAAITAMVGQAISTDTPSVTGTVTSYTVSPALPAGLSLNSSTGAISGTPTAVTAQAAYTVTATNTAGSTTASVQIAVGPAIPPPSNLAYPQASITAMVGQAISTDIPSVTGTVTSYAVSPALPAGLSLNSSTGAISGTPTAVTAQAAYTVTATNAGGSTTASVSIKVTKALVSLLDLGHAAPIKQLRTQGTRVLSQDSSGHWALWDYASAAELASGDQQLPPLTNSNQLTWLTDMAGPTVAIGISNGLEVRSSTDGHLLATIVSPMIDLITQTTSNTWWKLASDGSYVCAGSPTGLSVWSPNGQQLVSRTGDYSKANVFAAPGEVRVALGAAGQSVIETISTADGSASVGPAFTGQFNSWFLDGERFLTNTGTTVWTYSKSSAQQAIVALPTIENLTGQGNWIWTYSASVPSYPLAIYSVGGNSPVATFNLSVSATVVPSAMTIGVLSVGTGASVIDLSGSTPSKVDYTYPIAYTSVYAATSAAKWLVGNVHGVVLDGASLPNGPRYLGFGTAWSIAGGSGRVAVAAAIGKILYFDPAVITPQGSINFSSSKVALSSDGTVLAGAANANDAQYESDRSLNIYSLPGGTLTSNTPYQFLDGTPNLFDFSMSSSGTTVGQVLGTFNTNLRGWNYTRKVTPTGVGTVIWSDTPPEAEAIQLSPDGTLIAASSGPPNSSLGSGFGSSRGPSATTNIFKNGQVVTAIPGWVVGWIDNNRILVNTYSNAANTPYAGCAIYDATGAKLATPALPELLRLQPLTSDSIYSPDLNTIFSLSTAAATWTGTSPTTKIGSVAGSYVIYASGSHVLVDSY